MGSKESGQMAGTEKAATVQCPIHGPTGSRHGLDLWKSKTLPLDGRGGLRNVLRWNPQVGTSTWEERSLHTRHHAKPNVNQPELPVGWTQTKETVLNVDTIPAEG